MKTLSRIVTIVCAAALTASCAKDQVVIGSAGPDVEIIKCIQLSKHKRHEDVIQCLEMFKARYPESKQAAEAELMIGDTFFDKKEYLLAAESYAAFIKLRPFSDRLDYAYYRRGVALLKETPKAIDRDQQYLEESIESLATVIRHFPLSPHRDAALAHYREARMRLARRDMYIGRFYWKTGQYKACLLRLGDVATQYKDTGLAPKALYMITVANIKLDDLARAQESFGIMATEYSNDAWTKKAERAMKRAVQKIKS